MRSTHREYTQGEKANHKRREIYKYTLGYRFTCIKCKYISKIYSIKSICTRGMQYHLTVHHKDLTKKDMLLEYVYGVFNVEGYNCNTKTVIFMNLKEYSFFRNNPIQRDKINKVIKKLVDQK